MVQSEACWLCSFLRYTCSCTTADELKCVVGMPGSIPGRGLAFFHRSVAGTAALACCAQHTTKGRRYMSLGPETSCLSARHRSGWLILPYWFVVLWLAFDLLYNLSKTLMPATQTPGRL